MWNLSKSFQLWLGVEQRSDSRPEKLEGKRLLQEAGAVVINAVADDRVVGIPGNQQDTGIGPGLADVVHQAASADVGHDDVGNQQVDLPAEAVGDFNGLFAVAGLQDLIAAADEVFGGGVAKIVFVIHQQNGFGAAIVAARRR